MIVLFLNHKIQSCGVYQYGLRVFNILKKSYTYTYIYKEIDNYNEYNDITNKIKPNIIIYNYHAATMPWLNNNNILKNTKNIGIPHESNGDMFDLILSIDPNELETNKNFSIPRPIYENVDKLLDNYKITNKKIEEFINYTEGINVPIFGSFGFGFTNKGFDKIIRMVNHNYDEAIIKLVITFAHFDPNRDVNINHVLQLCNSVSRKPNIKLMILNDFLTNEEVLLFLKSNTCNIFLYDKLEGRGISSVIDYAISVNKPFVISNSYMFRHIYSDNIFVYKTNIRDAIENSKKILPNLLEKYSNKNLINKIDSIINTFNTFNTFNTLNNSNKIFDYNVSAYYHSHNYTESANVTDKLLVLFNNYKHNNVDTFIVSNDIFTDTCVYVVKTLFININIDNENEIFKINFKENEDVSWSDILNKINNHLDMKKEKLLIEVSIGEIIDKYSILELKQKYISDVNKLQDIEKEMNLLEKYISDIKTSHFYKMLLYINEQIWLDTDIIKELNVNVNDKDHEIICKLTEIYNRIFDNNQRRFRLKNHFNTIQKSNIKEHKSYAENSCLIDILEESDIYAKIPEINYLCISYDIVYFNHVYKNIIEKLFININIKFIEVCNVDSSSNIFDLKSFTINTDIRDFFEFNTIKYKSAGRLGDYLNQLSVVCENYYKTGRKGELYIYNFEPEGEFIFGIEHTYLDTYNAIISLNFIKNYKIYNNETIDIDLSTWRNHLHTAYLNKENWFHIYSKVYDVDWAKHKWLSSSIDPTWNDKIIINITPYRFILINSIFKLIDEIKDNINDCIFISNEKEHYDYFITNTGLNIEYYKPKNFEETVIIVNSCKIGYFGLSSMAVIANALHKNHYLMCQKNTDYDLNNMKDIIPHVLDILV